MAGFFVTDAGKTVKTGRINSTRSNPKLQQRPDAGRAPNFRQGVSGGNQQSVMPPKGGNWNPLNWFKGKGAAAVTKGKAAVKAAPAVVKGAAVPAAKVVAPIVAGAVIGEAYKRTDRAPAVSGRGAGRATFRDSNNDNRPNLQTPPPPANPNDDWADPVAGKGPKNNQVGSDADPSTPGLQGPGALKPAAPAQPAGGSGETRTNANGLVSYGKDLSSLNAFTSAFTGGYEIADIKSAFQSNDLEGAYQNGSNKISTEESKYTLPDSATPSNVGSKYSMGSGDISIENTGYKIDGGSVPGTVGGNVNDPQDGTSSKPDVAESIRTVRMERQSGRGSRRDPRNRGGDADMFGGPEPSDASLTSPMYANSKRNKIRSTFLNHEGNSIQAVAAANAEAGYGKDSDGRARVNYGGKLYNFKDGMEQKGRNALMEGRTEDAFQYLDGIGDTPAASELSVSPQSEVKPGTITAPENKGGSLETTAPITKPSPEKFQEAQDFLTNNMQMLNRRTK